MATKAEAIKAALAAIAERGGGRLTPAAVVAEASAPESPLHSCFTWSDNEAAGLRRLDEARTLIRSVRVTFTNETRVISAPLYVRDVTVDSSRQGYVALPQVVSDREAARRTIVRELLVAESAMERAHAIAEVLGANEEVDGLALSIRTFRDRVATGEDVSPAM